MLQRQLVVSKAVSVPDYNFLSLFPIIYCNLPDLEKIIFQYIQALTENSGSCNGSCNVSPAKRGAKKRQTSHNERSEVGEIDMKKSQVKPWLNEDGSVKSDTALVRRVVLADKVLAA